MQTDGDDQHNESAASITLLGGVAMGTGVMIGAAIFALTGQIAELAGPLFPLSFIAGALVTSLAAYSYIKMSNRWPSPGGIAMILVRGLGIAPDGAVDSHQRKPCRSGLSEQCPAALQFREQRQSRADNLEFSLWYGNCFAAPHIPPRRIIGRRFECCRRLV